MQGHRNASGAKRATSRRVPLRTIDDLDRREHEALTSERDAVLAISALLRELAVRLPDDSRLIRVFAAEARSLDILGGGTHVATSCGASLDNFIHRLVEHFEQGRACRRVVMARFSREYAYLRRDPCAWCGGPGGTIDHVVALARGGTNASDNLTGCCAACNQAKGPWPMLPFLLLRPWVAPSDRRERMVT